MLRSIGGASGRCSAHLDYSLQHLVGQVQRPPGGNGGLWVRAVLHASVLQKPQ